jgi:hypothetical protein
VQWSLSGTTQHSTQQHTTQHNTTHRITTHNTQQTTHHKYNTPQAQHTTPRNTTQHTASQHTTQHNNTQHKSLNETITDYTLGWLADSKETASLRVEHFPENSLFPIYCMQDEYKNNEWDEDEQNVDVGKFTGHSIAIK